MLPDSETSRPFDCLIGLGANVGQRQQSLDDAIQLLAAHRAVDNLQHSRWHTTAPIGGPSGQDAFLNGAARFQTTLAAEELLELIRDIERQVGRQRVERWGPRVIDIDLLLYGQSVIVPNQPEELAVPHPRMAFRRFVLQPAEEIAADMTHPVIGWTIAELLEHLRTCPAYVAMALEDTEQARPLALEVERHSEAEILSPTQMDDLGFSKVKLPLKTQLVLHDGEIDASVSPRIKLWVVDRPYQDDRLGPFLDIANMMPEQALTEVLAAIEAMRE